MRFHTIDHSAIFLFLFSVFILIFSNCFTIYPEREEIINSKLIDSNEDTQVKQLFQINAESEKENLILILEGGDFKQRFISDKISKNIIIHYSFRMSDDYRKIKTSGKRWSRHFLFAISDFAALFELITIPFRTISETKEVIEFRQTVLESEKIRNLDPKELSLILRIQDQEFRNVKIQSLSYSVSLREIYKDFPQAESIEVLVYKDAERIAYKVVFINEAIRKMLGN